MLNPIETKGMGKLAVNDGEDQRSGPVCGLFHNSERTTYLCQRLRVPLLADRPAQVT